MKFMGFVNPRNAMTMYEIMQSDDRMKSLIADTSVKEFIASFAALSISGLAT